MLLGEKLFIDWMFNKIKYSKVNNEKRAHGKRGLWLQV